MFKAKQQAESLAFSRPEGKNFINCHLSSDGHYKQEEVSDIGISLTTFFSSEKILHIHNNSLNYMKLDFF